MNSSDSIRDRWWLIAIVALIIGIALGVFYGWVINPVEWTDATPEHLRADLREDYLRMVIDSYSVNNDVDLAVRRYNELGVYAEETMAAVAANPGSISANSLQNFRAAVEIFEADLPTQEAPDTDGGQASGDILGTLMSILPWLCGIGVFIGVVAFGIILVRRRRERAEEPTAAPVYEEEYYEYEPDDFDLRFAEALESEDEPLATFRTIYSLGDDLYDDSFSIEGPTGDFLGECGVGIGDIIGVGEPKKVSAFEVWLFDKNDIQTVTKVLMSSYAYNDQETRARLAAKGDPVLADSGSVLELNTASLRIEARIVDITYGEGALPSESFFDRIAIELRAWPQM
ncbi:MAG: hypothetical protein GTO18_01355 [Anaerolineales bacterium]|nr:hypothetical protein [Anaerolineales bacterium]